MASVLGDDIDILAKARRALPADYTPGEDEEYLSEQQLNYFRVLLLEWKKSILTASEFTLQSLQDGPIREPDLNDRASSETDWGIELRTRDRQRKLIAKIDAALRRIDEGDPEPVVLLPGHGPLDPADVAQFDRYQRAARDRGLALGHHSARREVAHFHPVFGFAAVDAQLSHQQEAVALDMAGIDIAHFPSSSPAVRRMPAGEPAGT